MTEGMKCTSCKKHKFELKQVKSKLLPKTPMFLCAECMTNRREPRAYIIIAGRAGMDISYYIKGHRYVGDAITARELM